MANKRKETKKNKLSVYLIKPEFIDEPDIVKNYIDTVLIEDVGTVYLGESIKKTPKWATSFLRDKIDTERIFTSNARAVLLVHIGAQESEQERIFAVTMGYGKSMLKDDVVEERFGLKVILNTIQVDSLRRINRRNIGGNQKLSNEQLPIKSDIGDFDLDVNRDLVNHIAGVSVDEGFAPGIIAGGDILSLTAEVDVDSVKGFLETTFLKYKSNEYRKNFPWIDRMQDVKDSRLINRLNEKIVELINAGSTDIWMAVPEIIDWQEINGFKYSDEQDLFDDVFVDKVRDSIKPSLSQFDQLKRKQIHALSSLDDGRVLYSWTAAKCLFGEIEYGGKTYCVNNCKWYCIDSDFVKEIDEDYQATLISPIVFDEYTSAHTSEAEYSKSFANNHADDYLLMDTQTINYGGGRSKIELCDILSKNTELIHIKPYSGSATLSHLFNQGAVSAETLLSDNAFWEKANEKIREVSKNDDFVIEDRKNMKVVYGIIKPGNEDLPKLPFFSKVALRYVKHRLKILNVDVCIKGIAKTVS